LVHNFKYRGIEAAGAFLAASMAPLVPKDITLVPLPRVDWRCLRYGIDPSLALARQLARIVGCRMETALSPPWFNPDQAIRSREKRRSPRFSLNRLPDGPLVLIDDVVTTGGTVRSARQALGSRVVLALSATTTPW
jgi:predicted amidophosphoribosyltransferase